MEKVRLLDHISRESLNRMIPCFHPLTRSYARGALILTYEGGRPDKVAVLSEGTARLEILNEEGEIFLLESYEKGAVFGQLFSLPLDNFVYLVRATTDCTVIYLDYDHIITPCAELCAHHSQLISNLFMMTAQKSQELTMRLSILSQSTIREKLLTYLKHVRSRQPEREEPAGEGPGKTSGGADRATKAKLQLDRPFTIPISLGQLAEYLMVDRSSLMREIGAVKKEGLIESKNRTFRILAEPKTNFPA